MTTPALIALGGNRGDVRAAFAAALAGLDGTPGVRVTAASRAFETPAVGANAGGAFLNAAATVETDLSPHDLLTELHRLEAAAGRVRGERWGPRPLDLDLILFGTGRVADGRLTVPHPAFRWRRFVLDPACEVAADWPVRGGGTVGKARAALLVRPLPVAVATADGDRFAALRAALGPTFPVRLFRVGPGTPTGPTPPLVLIPGEGSDFAAARDKLAAALPDPEPAPVGPSLW